MTHCHRMVDLGRRQFLRGGAVAAVAGATATIAGPARAQGQTAARVAYPENRLANDYAQRKARFLLEHLDDLFLE